MSKRKKITQKKKETLVRLHYYFNVLSIILFSQRISQNNNNLKIEFYRENVSI